VQDLTSDRTIKKCRGCDTIQPITEFAKNGVSRHTGRQLYHGLCKPCWQKYKRHAEARGPRNRVGTGKCRDCSVELTDQNRVPAGKSPHTGQRRYQNRCRTCWAEYGKNWRIKRPCDPNKAKDRMLRFQFGIDLDSYNRMFREQNGVCAVCGQAEYVTVRKTGAVRALAVDHCHKTNKIRGLLCALCNRAAGAVKDDPTIATRLAAYLSQ
jgi:hypothetical protein